MGSSGRRIPQQIAISAEAPEAKAMKDRKESFGDYEVIHSDYEMAHLWLVNLPKTDSAGRVSAPAEPKQLTKEETFSVQDFSFSPDGKRIAFSASRDPDLISMFSEDIYLCERERWRSRRRLWTRRAPIPTRIGRRMGSELLMSRRMERSTSSTQTRRIAVIDAVGGTPRVVSDAFDEDADLLKWAPDGIYFSGLQKMSSSLFLLDPESGSVKKFAMPGSEMAEQFTFSNDFKQVAYRGASANRVWERSTRRRFRPRRRCS